MLDRLPVTNTLILLILLLLVCTRLVLLLVLLLLIHVRAGVEGARSTSVRLILRLGTTRLLLLIHISRRSHVHAGHFLLLGLLGKLGVACMGVLVVLVGCTYVLLL